MATQFSPQLVAALLLSSFVAAQYSGLRAVRNLRETAGISLCIAATLPIASMLDWLLTQFVLLPLGLGFLRFFIAVLLIAVTAHIVEAQLARRYPDLFPLQDNFLPLIVVGSLILWLPLHSDNDLAGQLIYACAYAAGAALLLTLFQALREHNAKAEIPRPLRGAAIDMLSAGILVAACGGLAGIF